eukprot:m.24366 g.24366  ORF g.24366 m.24366 type:complete len:359 (-) comp7602_c0_seq4:98-1174(-)
MPPKFAVFSLFIFASMATMSMVQTPPPLTNVHLSHLTLPPPPTKLPNVDKDYKSEARSQRHCLCRHEIGDEELVIRCGYCQKWYIYCYKIKLSSFVARYHAKCVNITDASKKMLLSRKIDFVCPRCSWLPEAKLKCLQQQAAEDHHLQIPITSQQVVVEKPEFDHSMIKRKREFVTDANPAMAFRTQRPQMKRTRKPLQPSPKAKTTIIFQHVSSDASSNASNNSSQNMAMFNRSGGQQPSYWQPSSQPHAQAYFAEQHVYSNWPQTHQHPAMPTWNRNAVVNTTNYPQVYRPEMYAQTDGVSDQSHYYALRPFSQEKHVQSFPQQQMQSKQPGLQHTQNGWVPTQINSNYYHPYARF